MNGCQGRIDVLPECPSGVFQVAPEYPGGALHVATKEADGAFQLATGDLQVGSRSQFGHDELPRGLCFRLDRGYARISQAFCIT
jgi:hypothetical protein